MALAHNYFQNAHDFELNDTQFFNIANGNLKMTINKGQDNDSVSTILERQIAAGAMFDSAERYPPGKCHPGTREKISKRIVDWVDDPAPTQTILWIYGPAGSGKSALAQSICERLRQHLPERYAGSFFFSSGNTDRGNSLKLFATLSYQLALQFPPMRREVNRALYGDPSLPTKSMEVQLFSLIIQPLLRCPSFSPHSPTLIIDGLDECHDNQEIDIQRKIIVLIAQSIVAYNIPIRFMIASRPETWIRDTFERTPLPNITLSLSLRDDQDADKDIEAYLTEEFEKIRQENIRIMGSVTLPWPPKNVVDRFVYEASGQFIYAKTVLKFVGRSSRFNDPQEQLRILTSPGPHRASAFSELDRLYETILSTYPRWTTMKRVLGGILAGVNSAAIEIILGVDRTEIILVMDSLSALIDFKRPGPLSEHELLLEPIFGPLLVCWDRASFSHLSFQEFLVDQSRSKSFYIDSRAIWNQIYSGFFGIINHCLDQNYDREPYLSMNIGLATYQDMMFTIAYDSPLYPDIDALRPLIIDMTNRLRLVDPGLEMKHVKSFVADMHWLHLMLREAIAFTDPDIPSPNYPRVLPGYHFAQEEIEDFSDKAWVLITLSSAVQNRSLYLWSSCNKVAVTPTLAYMHDFLPEPFKKMSIKEMLTIPGHTVTDILATLQQHRDLIRIVYRYNSPGPPTWRLSFMNIDDILSWNKSEIATVMGDWRTTGEWKYQRISLVYRSLKTTLNNGFDPKHPYWYLGKFFMCHALSDIQTGDYFNNPYNLSILTLITNFSAWSHLVSLAPPCWTEVGHLIPQVLCWFNRQLTNNESLKLLNDHDKNLVERMRTTTSSIFERIFLPNFNSSYYSELYLSTLCDDDEDDEEEEENWTILIKVLPLPQNSYQEEESTYISYEDLYDKRWRPLYDMAFRKTPLAEDQHLSPSTIDRSQWYPYLASRLLNAFAKLLYGKVYSEFELPEKKEMSKDMFLSIVECLPYAQTTQQNLDSLRAIVYFFPKSSLKWNPPIEFWYLTVEFLKKYDRSILSEKELNLFESWLYSMGRYMKRYFPQLAITGSAS